jgi:hypothetical protein
MFIRESPLDSKHIIGERFHGPNYPREALVTAARYSYNASPFSFLL